MPSSAHSPILIRVTPIASQEHELRAETMSPTSIEMQIRLRELQAERLLASSEGLDADTAYMADLDDEIAEVSNAYVGAAVTEIATLRAELFGPQVG
jgi:hypothetical protein